MLGQVVCVAVAYKLVGALYAQGELFRTVEKVAVAVTDVGRYSEIARFVCTVKSCLQRVIVGRCEVDFAVYQG